jgi:signal peptidase I
LAKSQRRTEQAGIFHFLREMGSALIMALIAIVYVIQAFKIPTGSMEDSLLVGDFLLGLKFIYGAPIVPFSQELGISTRFPAVSNPKSGDVIIFKYPGMDKKDYIKRCIAGPGSVLEIHDKKLTVDGKELQLPPRGKFLQDGLLDKRISDFKPLRIPAKGDVIKTDNLDTREFLFLKNLIHQENPLAKVRAVYQLYINGEFANKEPVQITDPISRQEFSIPFENLKFDYDDWTRLDDALAFVKKSFEGKDVDIRKMVYVNDKPVREYKVKFDNYFMMGDNRDNSMDSRYWGYLNRNFIKAKAFILYFSLDKNIPYWQLPIKIRWDRIGKLIRAWDGYVTNASVTHG